MDTIYVVEFDDYIRVAIGEYLQGQGFKVKIFESTQRALLHIRLFSAKPNVIILNLDMDNGSGFLDELAKDEVKIPVYLMYKEPSSLPSLLYSNLMLGNGSLSLSEMKRCISNAMSERSLNRLV